MTPETRAKNRERARLWHAANKERKAADNAVRREAVKKQALLDDLTARRKARLAAKAASATANPVSPDYSAPAITTAITPEPARRAYMRQYMKARRWTARCLKARDYVETWAGANAAQLAQLVQERKRGVLSPEMREWADDNALRIKALLELRRHDRAGAAP